MNGPVLLDHATLLQVRQVNLLMQRLRNDRLQLSAVELVKHVGGVALEGLIAVILGQAALNLKDLSHEIHDTIVKVKDYHHEVTRTALLIEVFRMINLVVDGVVHTAAADN